MKKLFIIAMAAIGLLACTETEQNVPTSHRNGVYGLFSVSDNVTVRFSYGNLRFNSETNKWKFAENQYDYIGGNTEHAYSVNGWMDLFGWGTGKNPTLSSKSPTDYKTFTDWGKNIDGGLTWRTLTRDEWRFLLVGRETGALGRVEKLHHMGNIEGIYGLILLPDKWKMPYGLKFVDDGSDGNANLNTFTKAQWSKLEKAGAVFLPAALNENEMGAYWSSTPYDGANGMAYGLKIEPNASSFQVNHNKAFDVIYRCSVRLVMEHR